MEWEFSSVDEHIHTMHRPWGSSLALQTCSAVPLVLPYTHSIHFPQWQTPHALLSLCITSTSGAAAGSYVLHHPLRARSDGKHSCPFSQGLYLLASFKILSSFLLCGHGTLDVVFWDSCLLFVIISESFQTTTRISLTALPSPSISSIHFTFL